MNHEPVDLLLATCNGERYLAALLDSLLAQTHSNWRLLVNDDCSTDATLRILDDYRARLGSRFVLLPSSATRIGVVCNFETLMARSLADAVADRIAFCDQDDVWLPTKLAVLVGAMQRLQSQAAADAPCLAHCDLAVVDAALAPIHPSFVRHQRYDPAGCSATAMLSINQVTGCAMMVNRSLLRLALPLPSAVLMHDWWCALLAGSGRRLFIDEPLVLYRQHGRNQLGARERGLGARAARLLGDAPGLLHRVRALGQGTTMQAQALRDRLAERGLDNRYVRDYLAWRGSPLWRRAATYRSHYPGPELDRCTRLLLW